MTNVREHQSSQRDRDVVRIDLSLYDPADPDRLDRLVLAKVGDLDLGSHVEVWVGSRPPARAALSWLAFHGHRQVVRVRGSDPLTEALWEEAVERGGA